MQYLLEGAAARSDTSTKVRTISGLAVHEPKSNSFVFCALSLWQITLLELAIEKILVATGQMSPGVRPTVAHQQSMTADELEHTNKTLEQLRLQNYWTLNANHDLEVLLNAQNRQLQAAKEAAVEHQELVRLELDSLLLLCCYD